MDLAIIDTFARSEAAPKSAPRSADDAPESFADILDTRLKASEPVRERAEAPDARETPREAPETKPTETAEAKTAESAPAAKPRTKPKAEHEAHEAKDNDVSTPETASTETEEAAPANKSTNAVLVAELLSAADSASTDSQPASQDVVATIIANATPEKTTAANSILSLVTMAGAPQPDDGAAPVTTAPVQTPAATPAQIQAPATTPSTNAPNADFAAQLNATTETPDTVPAARPAPLKLPETATAEIAATTTAAAAVAAELQSQADKSDALDLAADLSGDAADDGALATVTLASPSTAAPRAAPAPGTTSGYAAQLASQETISDPSSAPTPDVVKPGEITAGADKDAQSAELADDGDKALLTAAATKASFTDTAVASSTTGDHTVRAAAQAEAAAQRGTRPAALPVVEQVAVRISKAISDGIDRINVKLNPADLGQIDIRMEIGPDGKFNAVFAADRPQTVELLQRDARELARSLQDAGLRADTGSLSFNLRGQNNQGQQANGSLSAFEDGGNGNNGGETLPEAAPMPANLYSSSNAANGRVDIRV